MLLQLYVQNAWNMPGSFTLIKDPYHEQKNILDFWDSTKYLIRNNNISDFPIT